MRAARRARAADPRGGGAVRPLGIFATLAGGVGDLVAATARSIEKTGSVEVRLGVGVRSLAPAGWGFRVSLSDGSTVRADAVIVATPGPAAVAFVEPFAPAVAQAVGSIPHGSSAVVTTAWRHDRIVPIPSGHGILVPASEGLPISALTFSSQKWPGRAPDDAVLIRAFLPDEPIVGRSDGELVDLARRSMARVLGIEGEPELVRVSSFRSTMPRYTVGHLARVARAEADLARWPTAALIGAPYRGVGLPDCIAAARAAAARIVETLSGGGDPEAIVARPADLRI